jgi:organic hydroperoxide reductase OsmC/OhrA
VKEDTMPIALRQAQVVWDGTPRITTAELTLRARVPDLDNAGLERNVARAADLCPVSGALRGNVEISVHDELDEG